MRACVCALFPKAAIKILLFFLIKLSLGYSFVCIFFLSKGSLKYFCFIEKWNYLAIFRNVYTYIWFNTWEKGRANRSAQFADAGYKVRELLCCYISCLVSSPGALLQVSLCHGLLSVVRPFVPPSLFFSHFRHLQNRKSDKADTWWEALWPHGDSELLISFHSDIQDSHNDGHLEILQSTSPPKL